MPFSSLGVEEENVVVVEEERDVPFSPLGVVDEEGERDVAEKLSMKVEILS